MNQEERALLEGTFNEEVYWEALMEWYKNSIVPFYTALNPMLEKVQKQAMRH
jgi:hypothetical protein